MPGKNIAFPYRRIPDELLELSVWTWHTGDADEKTETAVNGWDYDTDLTLSRKIRLNVRECISAAGLDLSSGKIGVVVVIETGPAGYRWTAYQDQISGEDWEKKIDISIKSPNLAGGLRINTDLVLLNPGARPGNLSATKIGSRLWSDSHQIALEGSSSRFPMDTQIFRKSLPHLSSPLARWYLHWRPEYPEGSFIGNVVLYLNAENKNFMASVLRKDPLPLAWITSDIIRQMCSQLIESDEFVLNSEDYQDESVGGVVRVWLRQGFEGMEVSEIRSLYQQSRPKYESMLQSVFGGKDV